MLFYSLLPPLLLLFFFSTPFIRVAWYDVCGVRYHLPHICVQRGLHKGYIFAAGERDEGQVTQHHDKIIYIVRRRYPLRAPCDDAPAEKKTGHDSLGTQVFPNQPPPARFNPIYNMLYVPTDQCYPWGGKGEMLAF